MHNYTPHMSDIGPYKACTLCIQIHWVTHTDICMSVCVCLCVADPGWHQFCAFCI